MPQTEKCFDAPAFHGGDEPDQGNVLEHEVLKIL